jgi:hypothetical protein
MSPAIPANAALRLSGHSSFVLQTGENCDDGIYRADPVGQSADFAICLACSWRLLYVTDINFNAIFPFSTDIKMRKQ